MRYIQAFLITTSIFAISIYMISFIFKKVSVVNREKVIKVVTITQKVSAKIVKKAEAKKEQPTIKQKPNKEPQTIIQKPTKKIIKPKVLHKNIGKKTEKKRLVKKESLAKKVATKKRKKIVAKNRKKVVNKKIIQTHKVRKKPQKFIHIKKYKYTKHSSYKNKKHLSNKSNMAQNNSIIKSSFLSKVRAKIKANLVYPQEARYNHIEGSVEVIFNILPNGRVDNIRFLKAKRVFRKSILNAFNRVFPIYIPAELKAQAPFLDIYLPLEYKIKN